jgi:hypothetical protein
MRLLKRCVRFCADRLNALAHSGGTGSRLEIVTQLREIKKALRGNVTLCAALLEVARRASLALRGRYAQTVWANNRSGLSKPRLKSNFAAMAPEGLLEHFRARTAPRFFAGFDLTPEMRLPLQQRQSPEETKWLLDTARKILEEHHWQLLGHGELSFGEEINWLRDPVSGAQWPRDYHASVALMHEDGSEVRSLWELNRLGHLIILGRAYALTADERFAEDFFSQVESWRKQNRYGYGPNWSCAMEAALRVMNLLAAFHFFRHSQTLSEPRLAMLLAVFEEHGNYIRGHLEFSYIATGNHYLSDVVGLLWLGICLPELEKADAWRTLGFGEMLREMDKQVLMDGADYESSTGYHRFVLELFLYSFILCRANSIEIEDKYWRRLRSMFAYLRAYLSPDGHAPLIGDSDSGQVVPIVRHKADDHEYLLGIGAVLFNEPDFKIEDRPPTELWWLLGEPGIQAYEELQTTDSSSPESAAFADAGTYILRTKDLYMLFNASGVGLKGRGAHGHNDALSVEVSACGTSFLSDPGTYVYTSDLPSRHLFRSTAYHSTVEIDGQEQNETDENSPFRLGDEAHPRVLHWETGDEYDVVIAEHYGYRRSSAGPVTHRRSVVFDKRKRHWLITDDLSGSGSHSFGFCFHIAPGLETKLQADGTLEVCDNRDRASLLIAALDFTDQPTLEPRWFSRDFGAKLPSSAVCWKIHTSAPIVVRWLLVPVCPGDDRNKRLESIADLGSLA